MLQNYFKTTLACHSYKKTIIYRRKSIFALYKS